MVKISVIIPLHNESESISSLLDELSRSMNSLGETWEVLCMDDGSDDDSLDRLHQSCVLFEQLRVYSIPMKSGQSRALWEGLCRALGEIIVTLDADGQNSPADIPKMLHRLKSAEMVVGIRTSRKDPWRKRVFSKYANHLRNILTGSRLPDSGCSLRVFRSEVIACFLPFRGMHRFIPTMAELRGWRVVAMEVSHRKRRFGKSKYKVLDRMVTPLFDCLALAWLKYRRFPESHVEFVQRANSDVDSTKGG